MSCLLWFYKINDVETDRKREKISRFPSVITLVVVRTTKKIVGPPNPFSWWSCGPLLIKVCVEPWHPLLKPYNLFDINGVAILSGFHDIPQYQACRGEKWPKGGHF